MTRGLLRPNPFVHKFNDDTMQTSALPAAGPACLAPNIEQTVHCCLYSAQLRTALSIASDWDRTAINWKAELFKESKIHTQQYHFFRIVFKIWICRDKWSHGSSWLIKKKENNLLPTHRNQFTSLKSFKITSSQTSEVPYAKRTARRSHRGRDNWNFPLTATKKSGNVSNW